ncbi:MAG: manganese efflux pump MntP family protein, partial [Anaerovoracaceae bacterium]
MTLYELLILAVGVSMDAFAVSIAKGLTLKKRSVKYGVTAGLWFGGFQFLMPVIGYYLGSYFAAKITKYDHWIAFILLAIIGGNMIREALSEEESSNDDFSVKTMFIMAVATSIDALAIGVSFAFLRVNIWTSSIFIGITTFLFSVAGIELGRVIGEKFESKAKFTGGVILIAIGL